MLLSYQDFLGNPAASAQVTNVIVKTVTRPPVLLSPVTGATNNVLGVQYVLPDAPLPGSVRVLYFNLSNNVTLFLNDSSSNDFAAIPAHLSGPIGIVSNSAPSLPDGAYFVLLTYQDFLGNAAASAQANRVTIKTFTVPPSLLAPAQASANKVVPVQYVLPDAPLAGSVQLRFYNSGASVTLFLNSSLSNNFTAIPANLAGPPAIVSSSAPSLPDGAYSVLLTYQDFLGNPAASAQVVNVIVKTATAPPVLLLPANNAANGMLPIEYFLPDTALAGSVRLVLNNPGVNITLFLNDAPANNFVANPANLAAAPQIISSFPPSMRDGVYSAVMSYQDYLGNPRASAQATNFLVQFNPVVFPPGGITFSNGFILITVTNLGDYYNDTTYRLLFSPTMNAPLANWADLGGATGGVSNSSGYQFQIPDTRASNA